MAGFPAFILCAHAGRSPAAIFPSSVDHDERSEAQLREGDRAWGGSVEHKLRAAPKEVIAIAHKLSVESSSCSSGASITRMSISIQIFPVAQANLTDFFRCL